MAKKSRKQLQAELATALAAVEALTVEVEATPEAETPEEAVERLTKELADEKAETARQAKVITDAATYQKPVARTAAQAASAIAKAKALLNQ